MDFDENTGKLHAGVPFAAYADADEKGAYRPLIVDSDTATVVPYFLTANHCISTATEASSLKTYFNYVTTCGNPNCASPYDRVRKRAHFAQTLSFRGAQRRGIPCFQVGDPSLRSG